MASLASNILLFQLCKKLNYTFTCSVLTYDLLEDRCDDEVTIKAFARLPAFFLNFDNYSRKNFLKLKNVKNCYHFTKKNYNFIDGECSQ